MHTKGGADIKWPHVECDQVIFCFFANPKINSLIYGRSTSCIFVICLPVFFYCFLTVSATGWSKQAIRTTRNLVFKLGPILRNFQVLIRESFRWSYEIYNT